MYPQLSNQERDRRTRAIAELLDSHGVEVAMMAVTPANQARIDYVAGTALAISEGVLVVQPRSDTRLLVPAGTNGPGDTGWLSIIRSGNVRKDVHQLIGRRRLSVIGPTDVRETTFGLFTEVDVEADVLTDGFDALRARKSAEEIVAVEESAHLLDRCTQTLLDSAEPGITEQQIAGQIHLRALQLGASSIRVSVHRHVGDHSETRLTVDRPGGRTLRATDVALFSIELAGPTGYWVASCRPITFIPPDEAHETAVRGAGAALATVVRHLKPTTDWAQVLDLARRAAIDEGSSSQVVIRSGTGNPDFETFLPEDPATPQSHTVFTVMATTLSAGGHAVARQTDTVLIERDASRRLSSYPIGSLDPSYWASRQTG